MHKLKPKNPVIRFDVTFNNSRISLIQNGNIVFTVTAGMIVEGTKKSAPVTARRVAEMFLSKLQALKMTNNKFDVHVGRFGNNIALMLKYVSEALSTTTDSAICAYHYATKRQFGGTRKKKRRKV